MSQRVIVNDEPIRADMIAVEGLPEAAFWDFSAEDDFWEYVEGTLYMHSPVSTRHQELSGFLNALLVMFVEERRLGRVLAAPAVMRLRPRRCFEPDIQVILAAHEDRIRPECVEGPADLVIEIVSPGNASHDLELKRGEYKAGGVPEVWFVDEARERVLVSGASVPEREVRAGPLVSTVLPGFAIDVAWALAPAPPRVAECLARLREGWPA